MNCVTIECLPGHSQHLGYHSNNHTPTDNVLFLSFQIAGAHATVYEAWYNQVCQMGAILSCYLMVTY